MIQILLLPESNEPECHSDLSPKNKTMTLIRFPLIYPYWRSQHEETLQRRTNYPRHERARRWC